MFKVYIYYSHKVTRLFDYVYFLNQIVHCLPSIGSLNRSFWAVQEGFPHSETGEKIKRSCSPPWKKKIEAGGELNCMSRDFGCDDKAAAAGK